MGGGAQRQLGLPPQLIKCAPPPSALQGQSLTHTIAKLWELIIMYLYTATKRQKCIIYNEFFQTEVHDVNLSGKISVYSGHTLNTSCDRYL